MRKCLMIMSWLPLMMTAQTYNFDMTKPQPVYSDDTGFGFD